MKHEEAFLEDWSELARFGAIRGTQGVDRQAASEADGKQRKWFAGLLQNYGFTVQRDAIGNQFGLLEVVPGAPYVLTGSHLDSQPTAGRFDGAYGVLASAHACFRIAEELRSKQTTALYNLAVVNWFNEEGSRFKPSMMGSGVFTGKLALNSALSATDPHGITAQEALDKINERGSMKPFDVASYAEIHVQQGRSMEEDGISIGLVDATWAAHKFELKVVGDQAHSGAALMEDRRDALLGAAQLIVAARELTDSYAPGKLHTACCELYLYPNSPVTVASEVDLHIDLRSPSADVIRTAYASFLSRIEAIKQQTKVDIEVTAEHKWDQNPYPNNGVELARRVAQEAGLSHDRVMTVAGHDSTNLKDIAPTIMLFVPSTEGISHNVHEHTSDQDMIAGLNHLTGVVRRLVAGEFTQ